MYTKAISLIFEVTQGCGYNCKGCMRDVGLTKLPSEEEFDKIIAFYDAMEKEGYVFKELELGPNDLATCSNLEEILSSEKLAKFASRFTRLVLSINFTQLDKEVYRNLARRFSKFATPFEMDLATPVELKHVFTEKYIDRIRENIAAFVECCDHPMGETVANIIIDENSFQDQKKYTLEQLFHRANELDIGPNTKVDFGLQAGMGGLNDPIAASNFASIVRSLNKLYLEDFKNREHKKLRYLPFHLTTNIRGDELLWSKGSFYIRPVINERLTLINDQVKYTGDLDPVSYQMFMMELMERNFERSIGTECENCHMLAVCTPRAVQDVMKLCRTKECISQLKYFGHIAPEMNITEQNKLDFCMKSGKYGYC